MPLSFYCYCDVMYEKCNSLFFARNCTYEKMKAFLLYVLVRTLFLFSRLFLFCTAWVCRVCNQKVWNIKRENTFFILQLELRFSGYLYVQKTVVYAKSITQICIATQNCKHPAFFVGYRLTAGRLPTNYVQYTRT